MGKLDDDVRAKARALKESVLAARAGGLRVSWPHRVEDLDGIAISETKVAAPKEDVDTKPAAPAAAPAQITKA